ncbi:MAG: efflux RND transporter permease subunit, partial [Myxococcota bacterium]
ELDREKLRAAGLTALDVERALARENATLPTGSVKRGFDDLYVRSLGEYRTLAEIERTVVAAPSGRPVRVRDLGAVVDGYESFDYLMEMNGVPAIHLGVQKQSGGNTVAVARAVRAEAERIHAERDDVRFTVVADQSEFIRDSISNVQSSALYGSLLAIAVLYLFLRNRSGTAIIAVAIPISVIATFALLWWGGMTLNQMTFGGLALGVGMIVDNAIVVLESVVRRREEEGVPPVDAARVGTSQVAGAIVASTLTTCVVFLPVAFTSTTTGALFQALALVVVFALVCSLFVALTLVPMLASRFLALAGGKDRGPAVGWIQRLEGWYVGRLRWAMRHRGRVFAATGAALALALALWPLVPVELAPQTDADEIDIELEMASGTNIAVSRAYV